MIKKIFTPLKNYKIMIFLFLLGVTFVMSMQSPLNPLFQGETTNDSNVFKYIALEMSKGYIPYKDMFDHKGPIIYFINLLGMYISYYRGVWVLEFFTLFLTYLSMYKIIRLYCSKSLSCICLMIATAPLFNYFQGGNLVEEYAMPFIALSLYYFGDYLNNQKITILRLLLCGLCFGVVLLFRPNMIVTWVVFCTAILIKLLYKRNIRELITFLLWFSVGLGIIIFPIYIYLFANGAIESFWDSYFLFNFMYSSVSIEEKINSFILCLKDKAIIISLLVCSYQLMKNEKWINLIYILYILFSMALISLSGRSHPHYMMVMIPVYAYPIASIGKICQENFFVDKDDKVINFTIKNSREVWITILMSYLVLVTSFEIWTGALNTSIYKFKNFFWGGENSR